MCECANVRMCECFNLEKIYLNAKAGERNSFDSDKEKDMSSTFGKPAKELLSQSFDMITDPSGKVLMVKPEKFEQSPQEDALKVVAALIQDLLSVAQPPKKRWEQFFQNIA